MTTTKTTIACISTADIAKAKVVPALLSVSSISLVAVSSRDKQRAQQFVDENCSKDTINNNWEIYPFIKLFKGDILIEMGTKNSHWDVHYMFRF